jgi:hypothetical protein
MATPEFNPITPADQVREFVLIDGEASDTDLPINSDRLHVVDFDLSCQKTSRNGFATHELRAVLNNHSTYQGRLTRYEEREQDFERMAIKSPAWWTEVDDPLNLSWTQALASEGMEVLDLSHEQILHANPFITYERFLAANVGNDAHAQHAVLDYLEREKITPKNTKEVIGTGLSKGAIVAMIMRVTAHNYDRKVVYVDGIDPSGEHPWNIKDFDLHKLKQLAYGPLLETVELAKVASEHSPEELLRATGRLAMLPFITLNHLASTQSLVAGDAGKHRENSGTEGIVHLSLKEDCWFNQHEGWKSRLGHLANMHVAFLPGGHLGGARKHIKNASVGRIVGVQNLLEQGIPASDIDPATQTVRTPMLARVS